MSVRATAARQHQAFVDAIAKARLRDVWLPNEGWIATVRKALGMSGADLARRLNVTRENVRKAEQSERAGAATLKTLQSAAEAMGCRFVYAIVPAEDRIEGLVEEQARKKARALVRRASAHMALEDQSLPGSRNEEEIERIAADLMRRMPSSLWLE